MKRWSLIISVWFGTIACFGSAALAQSSQMFSSDLVLWSNMQQPQQPEQQQPRQTPTPEPRPDTQPAQNPTPAQPGSHTPPETPNPQASDTTAQTFTGSISKETDSFVLKVSESVTYKLDNQSEVQQYEGKRVRITGRLDASVNLIHVDKVEPLS